MPPKKIPSAPSKTDAIKETLHLDGFAKQFMAEHIRGLIRMYAIHGVKDDGAIDLMYDILFLDPVTTRHFSQFQAMWKHRASTQPRHMEWWSGFRAFLRDCFDKTRVQMNRYHNENPPLPSTDSDPDSDPNSDDSDCDGDGSKRVKRDGRKDSWYPGIPKLQPPSHKRGTPLSMISTEPPKKRKFADISTDTGRTPTHTFRVCIVDQESCNHWDDIYIHHSSNRWHLSRVEKLSVKAIHRAVNRLSPGRHVSYMLGCLVKPDENPLRRGEASRLDSNDSVATFFSVTAYNPLIVVAVLEARAMSAAPLNIAIATPPSQSPQPPPESPIVAPKFVAINDSAQIAKETAQIVEASSRAVVEMQLQREARSLMAQVLEEPMCDVPSVSVGVEESSVGLEESPVGLEESPVGVEESSVGVEQSSVGVEELSESVAIGTHQDVNACMNFTQFEASRLTPPWMGQQFG